MIGGYGISHTCSSFHRTGTSLSGNISCLPIMSRLECYGLCFVSSVSERHLGPVEGIGD